MAVRFKIRTLIISKNRSQVFFLLMQPRLLFHISRFFAAYVFIVACLVDRQSRIGIRRVGSAIFRPIKRKSILKDSRRTSRGRKGDRQNSFATRALP